MGSRGGLRRREDLHQRLLQSPLCAAHAAAGRAALCARARQVPQPRAGRGDDPAAGGRAGLLQGPARRAAGDGAALHDDDGGGRTLVPQNIIVVIDVIEVVVSKQSEVKRYDFISLSTQC